MILNEADFRMDMGSCFYLMTCKKHQGTHAEVVHFHTPFSAWIVSWSWDNCQGSGTTRPSWELCDFSMDIGMLSATCWWISSVSDEMKCTKAWSAHVMSVFCSRPVSQITVITPQISGSGHHRIFSQSEGSQDPVLLTFDMWHAIGFVLVNLPLWNLPAVLT